MPGRDVGRKLPAGGLQTTDALAEPQAHGPRILENPGRQLAGVGPGGVAHGRHGLAAPGERFGNLLVHQTKQHGIFLAKPLVAVFPDQRMQPPAIGYVHAHRFKQTGKSGHASNSLDQIVSIEHLVEQGAVDATEQPDSQQERPVLRIESPPQPRLDPVFSDIGEPGFFRGKRPFAFVPGNTYRDGPTARLAHQCAQLPPGQPDAQESGDLRGGEPEVACVNERHMARQQQRADVHARRKLPAADGDAQIPGAPVQQGVHGLQGFRVVDSLQFVECQNAGFAVVGDRAKETVDAAAGRRVAGIVGAAQQVQTRLLESQHEMRLDNLRRIRDVQRQPSDQYSGVPGSSAVLGKEGGLAESTRGFEHRAPAAGVPDALDQLGAVEVAGYPIRNCHFLATQPGRCGSRGCGTPLAGLGLAEQAWDGKIGEVGLPSVLSNHAFALLPAYCSWPGTRPPMMPVSGPIDNRHNSRRFLSLPAGSGQSDRISDDMRTVDQILSVNSGTWLSDQRRSQTGIVGDQMPPLVFWT